MKKYNKRKEARKRVIALMQKRQLHLNDATMINNSQADTVNYITDCTIQCIDWQERHPDRTITVAELASNQKLPESSHLAMLFGSAPKFIDFFYEEDV